MCEHMLDICGDTLDFTCVETHVGLYTYWTLHARTRWTFTWAHVRHEM